MISFHLNFRIIYFKLFLIFNVVTFSYFLHLKFWILILLFWQLILFIVHFGYFHKFFPLSLFVNSLEYQEYYIYFVKFLLLVILQCNQLIILKSFDPEEVIHLLNLIQLKLQYYYQFFIHSQFMNFALYIFHALELFFQQGLEFIKLLFP